MTPRRIGKWSPEKGGILAAHSGQRLVRAAGARPDRRHRAARLDAGRLDLQARGRDGHSVRQPGCAAAWACRCGCCSRFSTRCARGRLLVHAGSAPLSDYLYRLTEQGRAFAQSLQQACAYVGPAPVPLADYVMSCEAQSIRGEMPRRADLERAFANISVEPGMLDALGPAINSGAGLFLYGSAGQRQVDAGPVPDVSCFRAEYLDPVLPSSKTARSFGCSTRPIIRA